MTFRHGLKPPKKVLRVQDLQETLDVKKTELQEERDAKRVLVEKLNLANNDVSRLEKRVADLEAELAREQGATTGRLSQEMDALKKETAYWRQAIPDEGIRVELASLLEWQFSLHTKIAETQQRVHQWYDEVGDLQDAERSAFLEGKTENFALLKRRIAELYDLMAKQPQVIAQYRATLSTKVLPMIDRVMSENYQQLILDQRNLKGMNIWSGDVLPPEEDVKDDASISQPDLPIPVVQPRQHQNLKALNKYPLAIVFQGSEKAKEISDLFQWLKAEECVRSLSEALILIEEDAYETRIERTVALKKWDMHQRIRARDFTRLLIDELPIWATNDLKDREVNLRVDREGALQTFLTLLDGRYQKHIARLEAGKLQTPKPVDKAKPVASSDISVASPTKNRMQSGGQLPRALVGKEDELLEFVPPSLFLKDRGVGIVYGRLFSDGIIESFEQMLRDVGKGILEEEMVKKFHEKKSRSSLKMIANAAQSMTSLVKALNIHTDDGELDRQTALLWAREILTSARGRHAFGATFTKTRLEAVKISQSPVHS